MKRSAASHIQYLHCEQGHGNHYSPTCMKGLEFKRGHTHSLPVWDLSSFQTTEPSHFHYDLALRTSTRRFGLHPAPCACTIPVLQLSSDPVSSWLMPKKMLSRPNDQFRLSTFCFLSFAFLSTHRRSFCSMSSGRW